MVVKSHNHVLDEDNLPVGMRTLTLDELRMDAPSSDVTVFRKGQKCAWCPTILNQHNPLNVCLLCLKTEVGWQRQLREIRPVKALRTDNAKDKKEAPEEHTLVALAIKALKAKRRKPLPPPKTKSYWLLNRRIPGEMNPDDWAWSSLLHPVY